MFIIGLCKAIFLFEADNTPSPSIDKLLPTFIPPNRFSLAIGNEYSV